LRDQNLFRLGDQKPTLQSNRRMSEADMDQHGRDVCASLQAQAFEM
jgi:hypothetical protein